MTKKEKARAILDVLEKYIPSVEVPLKHNDPFTLLIAVLLSAQCTDERVNQLTPKLFALPDDPFEMTKLSKWKRTLQKIRLVKPTQVLI